MSQIKFTSNYNKFKHLNGNRNIVEPHLRRLIKSIQDNGWLENSPVLVNQKYEIIDGQHRFEACKTLGLPIEYMVVYDEGLSTCIVRNNTARKWTATDFVRAKAAEGNDDFKLLLSYIEKYPNISAPEIFIVLGMYKGTLDFDWKYTMRGEEIKYLEELEWYAETFSKRRSFIHAVYSVLIYGGIDWKTLRKQMMKRGLPKPLAATATDTVRQLQDIYNYNLNEKNRVYFADEISKISKSTDLKAKRMRRQAEAKKQMNLYEYDRRLEECIDTETGEVDVEKLEQLNLERTEKLESLIMWSKEKRAFIESLKNEISKLEARLESEEKSADKLEAYIGNYLDHKKFKTPKCEVKFTKSTYVACDDEKEWVQRAIESGDTRFINITEKIVKNQKLDKTAIKAFLKDENNKLDGVHLETRYTYKAL